MAADRGAVTLFCEGGRGGGEARCPPLPLLARGPYALPAGPWPGGDSAMARLNATPAILGTGNHQPPNACNRFRPATAKSMARSEVIHWLIIAAQPTSPWRSPKVLATMRSCRVDSVVERW